MPLWSLVIALLAQAVPSFAELIELDLAGALQRAPQANYQILLASEAVTAQSEVVRANRSVLFPTIQAEASQSRAMAPNTDPFSASFPGIPRRFFADRFDAVLRARFSLIHTRSIDDVRLSRLDLKAIEWRLRSVEQDILQQIATAFYNHWRNQKRLEVIDQTLERDRILLQIATDQKEAGVATALDVTRAEVGLASDELSRLQQETALMDSGLLLKRALDLPMDAELVLQVDDLMQLAGQSPPNLEDRLEAVLSGRADYQQLRAELERESLARDAVRRERLPSLELSGQWGYASQTWSDDLQEQWAIQLGVSMPVFEGFRIDAQRRAAESAIRRKKLELADLRNQIEADYRLVVQQFESSKQQVNVASRSRDLNAREYEMEKIRFQQGVADNSDVVDAQTQLADAEDALVEAQFQFIRAWIDLARVEGNVMRLVQP